MSSSSVIVRVDNVGKRYDIYDRPSDRLRQFILPRAQRFFGKEASRFGREFWALRGVSFEAQRGESIGIIGRNGSGKSTLLQMITGVLAPTEGTVETSGRIAALLELGSGFNPEFSGQENVYMSGRVLGLSEAEINARYDQILAFADIGDFVSQPVKTYSSGMFVRLAFAVVAHVNAEVLVVDEALAVGDVFFGQKCFRFFREFRERGGTLLLVSHDSSAVVNLCDRAIWLESGRLIETGEPKSVCRRYLRNVYLARESAAILGVERAGSRSGMLKDGMEPAKDVWAPEQRENLISVSPFNVSSDAFGVRGAEIIDAGFHGENDERLDMVRGGQDVCLSVLIACHRTFEFPAVGLVFKDRLGQSVYAEGTTWAYEGKYEEVRFTQGERVRVDFLFPMPVLIEGNYSIAVAVAEGFGHEHVQHHLMHDALALKSISSRLLHGITGFSDVRIRMRFFRPEADTNAHASA
jgi:lipopolysaccharide transport system ATP-binding protein